jgi:hypothetical protein
MAWTQKPLFIGAHFWLIPVGSNFTSPAGGVVSQYGTWPDQNEPTWPSYALGACESFDLDPKIATAEDILAPSPGAVQAIDKISPYALPEVSFTLLQVDSLAIQLALNTAQLFGSANTQANPNGGGAPGVRGILKAQKYDHNNNLILNWQSWAFVQLKSALKGAPKTLTKPEYTASLLYSQNNVGTV